MDEQDTPPKDFSTTYARLGDHSAASSKQVKLSAKVECVRKKNINQLPLDSYFGLMKLPQVLAVMQVSRSNWLQGVKSGRYPESVRLSDRRVAWRIADLKAFIDSL
jgi:prophage regulatory protein